MKKKKRKFIALTGHCHPTFTIVQLSLRLADHIIECTNKNKI